MRYDFRLPDIGEGLKEAEVVQWLVAVGDVLIEDQPLVVVQTDKADVEIPVPVAGTVLRLGGEPGTLLDVGSILAEIDIGEERRGGDLPAGLPPVTGPSPTVASEEATAGDVAENGITRPKAAPAVRRRAQELGLDLTTIKGTGPNGRIVGADLDRQADLTHDVNVTPSMVVPSENQRAVAQRPYLDGEVERRPMRGRRRETARRMKQAWQEIPHMADFREVDARGLLAIREALREEAISDHPSLTFVPIMAKITATALQKHPILNATLEAGTDDILIDPHVCLGIATQTENGLVVPVVKHAEEKSIFELAAEVDALIASAQNGTLGLESLSGGTFTLNNIGSLGATRAFPIIKAPEVALMAFGRITRRPVVDGDLIVARPMMDLTTVADHRVVDGRDLTSFLDTVSALISDPLKLIGSLR